MMLPDELPEWVRPCPSHKIKYTSAEDARKQATVGTHTNRGLKSSFRGTLHIYRCHLCGSHHITSKTSRPNKKKFKKERPMPKVEVEILRTVTITRDESCVVELDIPKSVLKDGREADWVAEQGDIEDSPVARALGDAEWDATEDEDVEYDSVIVLDGWSG